jgi:hypothetical protein
MKRTLLAMDDGSTQPGDAFSSLPAMKFKWYLDQFTNRLPS